MSAAHGDRREQLSRSAMGLVAEQGLGALSFGRLAAAVGAPKSSVSGLYASKSDLQLAVVESARQQFADAVLCRASGERGLERLRSLLDAWTRYLETQLGGCFFSAAGLEFDGQPGAVHDAIMAATLQGVAALVEEISLARRTGELPAGTDDHQLAFELHAFITEANLLRQLLHDDQAFERAQRAIDARLDTAR